MLAARPKMLRPCSAKQPDRYYSTDTGRVWQCVDVMSHAASGKMRPVLGTWGC